MPRVARCQAKGRHVLLFSPMSSVRQAKIKTFKMSGFCIFYNFGWEGERWKDSSSPCLPPACPPVTCHQCWSAAFAPPPGTTAARQSAMPVQPTWSLERQQEWSTACRARQEKAAPACNDGKASTWTVCVQSPFWELQLPHSPALNL